MVRVPPGRDHRGIDQTPDKWGETLRRTWRPRWGPRCSGGSGGACCDDSGIGAIRLDSTLDEASGDGAQGARGADADTHDPADPATGSAGSPGSAGSTTSRGSWGTYGTDTSQRYTGINGNGNGNWNRHGHGHGHGHGHWRIPRRGGPLRRSRDARLIGGVAEGTLEEDRHRRHHRAGGPGAVRSCERYRRGRIRSRMALRAGGGRGREHRPTCSRRPYGALRSPSAFSRFSSSCSSSGRIAGAGWIDSITWAVGISAAGLILIWRNAPDEDRALLERLAEPVIQLAVPEGRSWTRISVRAAWVPPCLQVGSSAFSPATRATCSSGRSAGSCSSLRRSSSYSDRGGSGWRAISSSSVRRGLLAEERANMATRVHDSVLQTLALIQRRADDPQQVAKLAACTGTRVAVVVVQRVPARGPDGEDETVGAAVQRIQREVEADHGITVEVVTVGDCELDDNLRELLAAAREATVNSAKWSGADVVSVFAEVEPRDVSVFVRDRGKGFDPEGVPSDRKGVSESVYGRMSRHGGTAELKSSPGEGTDVALKMPRQQGRTRRAARGSL